MNKEMNEQDWRLAHELVDRLDPRSVDEVQKIQVYLRTRGEVEACKALVRALAANADSFTRMTREQQDRRGVSFIRNENFAGYYQNISRALNLLFDSTLDARREARILGWTVRLLRYYRTDEGRSELAKEQRSSPSHHKQAPRQSNARAEQSQKEAAPPVHPTRAAKPPRARPKPAQVQRETTTAAVTLLAPACGRRAKVQTEQGDEITCVLLPAYPIALPGEVCVAELTRENGRLVRAVFKGWKKD